jgi:hypothetical protein
VRDKLDIYVFIDVDDKGENVENRKKRYCDMLIQVYDNTWPGSTGVQSTGDQCLTSVKKGKQSVYNRWHNTTQMAYLMYSSV